MKILTYILIGLLILALAGAGYFYVVIHQPMAQDLAKMKLGLPEFERTKKDLKRCQDHEKAEFGWTAAVSDAMKTGLSKDISEGKAEVVVSGSRVVINIAEDVLFTPHSITFAKDSPQALANLAEVLKGVKDKEMSVGVETVPAPAQGKGRKRVPAKDARTLASGRALELVKSLVKGGVAENTLIASAYPSAMPDRGFKLKGEKVIIIISAPPSAGASQAATPKPEAKQAPAPQTAGSAVTVPKIKTIPISTVPPKKAQ